MFAARLWFDFSKEVENIQPCWAFGFASTISRNWVGSRKTDRIKKIKAFAGRMGVAELASARGRGGGCGCLRTVVTFIECLGKVIVSPSFDTSDSPY